MSDVYTIHTRFWSCLLAFLAGEQLNHFGAVCIRLILPLIRFRMVNALEIMDDVQAGRTRG